MINQEEYEILKSLDNGMKWISRDRNRKIFTFEEKPHKRDGEWVTKSIWTDFSVVGYDYVAGVKLFQFIQWNDEEPYRISDLIKEYEIKELRLAPSGTVIVDSFSESEETEVKDIEELPVIPKFVADWIENIKPNKSLMGAFVYIAQRKADNYDGPLVFWIEEENSETFARAWLDGYEIEEEPKFYVLDNEDKPLLIKFFQGIMRTPNDIDPIDEIEKNHRNIMQFTEQEIKDYDERYLPFKVPVEEIEE